MLDLQSTEQAWGWIRIGFISAAPPWEVLSVRYVSLHLLIPNSQSILPYPPPWQHQICSVLTWMDYLQFCKLEIWHGSHWTKIKNLPFFLDSPRRTCFLVYLDCWQNSAPCGCRTEIFFFFFFAGWWLPEVPTFLGSVSFFTIFKASNGELGFSHTWNVFFFLSSLSLQLGSVLYF